MLLFPPRLVLFAVASLLTLCFFGESVAQDGGTSNDAAQQFFPRQSFLLTGYGASGYNVIVQDEDSPNNFNFGLSPIMLFQISDRFLFESEQELEIEDGATNLDLEYAQIDARLSNNLTFVAGKFLLPFGTFSERYHPTWINRLISAPALYLHHGPVPTEPLIPIVSDIGFELRGAYEVGPISSVTGVVFVTQGPVAGGAEEEPTAGKRESAMHEGEAPGVLSFGANADDNNQNKLIGGRVGYVIAPHFEANLSGMTGKYDDEGELDFSAVALHLEGRVKHFTVHSEFIGTWRDLPEDEEDTVAKAASSQATAAATESLSRFGYWVQVGYLWNKLQPVVRWTQIADGDVEDVTLVPGGKQLALGLDYWFEPSLALKAEYMRNAENGESIDNDRFAVQLAFGF